MKYLITLFLVGALGGGGWYYFRSREASDTESAAKQRPRVATLETRNIRFAVTAAGDIGPAEQVSVRPEVNGRIEIMTVDVGDFVKAGDLLFSLDDKDLQIELDGQRTAVDRARLELEQAERNYRRAEDLFGSNLIALETFEDAKTSQDLAKNSLERTEKTLDLIVDRLRRTRVLAPFDCTVLTRPVSVGQAVSGSGGFNAGTEVMTIANLNDLIINAHINQADVTRLTPQQQVQVKVEAVPGLSITGTVERLAPQSTIKNNIRGFEARILLRDVDPKVRPGMTANISIPVASADNVLAAPLAGIFTETDPDSRRTERYVWVLDGQTWARREVQIGVSDYFFVEVTGGLSAGDVIALEDKSKEVEAMNPSATAKTPGGSVQAASAGRPGARTPGTSTTATR
jgi:RND family efflux transporter MFP subunit